ncbi:galactokinase [Pseudonocardia thermophila]|uniref:Galactokinase n=1 Tax=Pseudonocardia thermophila TaxID=1848 RepID=A0A1M6PEW2_PSETH|nr:galactokinase [Pseudonocardia thermophila]SHK06432.1 galactokinase [Pseudonocardia thermophila]
MSGTWSAPGRVNIIGEHVDYAEGLCLPFAIAERTVVQVSRRDDERLHLSSDFEQGTFDGELSEIGPGTPKGWAGYVAGVLWALRAAGHRVGGIDLHVTASVPLGAGLSSSAALECATAIAVDELFELHLPRTELAAACVRAENEVVGAATGGMDQAVSLLATAGHALLIDTRSGDTRQVPFAPAEAGLAVLVIDTKVRHALADGQYGKRRAAVEEAVARIGSLRDADLAAVATLPPQIRPRARHVVTEIARVQEAVALLEAGRLAEIGPLLDASHASLAGDFEVSSPELDLAVETARVAGALGARMVGGGFGGSAIALTPLDRVDAVSHAVRAAFAASGLAEPDVRIAEPSAGAARDQ